jgi:hypothetical protein
MLKLHHEVGTVGIGVSPEKGLAVGLHERVELIDTIASPKVTGAELVWTTVRNRGSR